MKNITIKCCYYRKINHCSVLLHLSCAHFYLKVLDKLELVLQKLFFLKLISPFHGVVHVQIQC